MQTTESTRSESSPELQTPSSSDDIAQASRATAQRAYKIAMAFALIAAGLAWGIGEMTLNAFEPPPRWVRAMGVLLNRPSFEAITTAELKNVSLGSGIFGACLAMALALAGGLIQGSWKRGGVIALGSGLLGFLIAGATTAVLMPYYYRALDLDQELLSHDLVLPFLIHAGTWAVMGAVAGLAFATATREKARRRFAAIVVGGVLGAILGTMICEALSAVFFASSKTIEPISDDWAPRLIAKLAVSLGVALGAVHGAASHRLPKPAPSMRQA